MIKAKRLPLLLPSAICLMPVFYRLYPVRDLHDGLMAGVFLCLGLILLLYAITSSISARFSFNYADALVMAFLGWLLINGIVKNNGNFSSDYLLPGSALLLYPAFKQSFQQGNGFDTFLKCILFTGLVIECYALLQLVNILPVINPVYKATSFFFNPDVFCSCITIQFPLVWLLFIRSKNRIIKILCGIYCIGVPIFNILLGSRAALLALLIITILLLGKSQLPKQFKRIALTGVIMLLAAGIAWSALTKTNSTRGRLLIWKVSAQMFREAPLGGIGYDGFKSRYSLYQAQYLNQRHSDQNIQLAGDTDTPFNDFIGIGIEEGGIGLLLFAAILIVVFFQAAGSGQANASSISGAPLRQ